MLFKLRFFYEKEVEAENASMAKMEFANEIRELSLDFETQMKYVIIEDSDQKEIKEVFDDRRHPPTAERLSLPNRTTITNSEVGSDSEDNPGAVDIFPFFRDGLVNEEKNEHTSRTNEDICCSCCIGGDSNDRPARNNWFSSCC